MYMNHANHMYKQFTGSDPKHKSSVEIQPIMQKTNLRINNMGSNIKYDLEQ